jgi:hypothetical protein
MNQRTAPSQSEPKSDATYQPVQRSAGTQEARPVPVELHAELRAGRETVLENSAWVRPLQQEIGRVIVGQRALLDRLLIALLTNGHVLLEGVPGLAKTLALKTLASCVAVRFKRLQFTPDMLPADIVGTMIYNPQDGAFRTKHGPIFSNLILADEINRAPAKVQSALLEAMQERQVTIGDETYALPNPFLVLATQNPLEQEGTIHDEGHRHLSQPRRRARHSGRHGDHRALARSASHGVRRTNRKRPARRQHALRR